MNTKTTVYDFVVNFKQFSDNVYLLIEEAYTNPLVDRKYPDAVFDQLDNYRIALEQFLGKGYVNVERSLEILKEIMRGFRGHARMIKDLCNMTGSLEYYEEYKFLNSVRDCYNEFVNELFS
jgi:hypothetical protein